MNQPIPDAIIIESLSEYSDRDAVEIGQLLAHLSDSSDGSPVTKELLVEIIQSPSHEQIVARGDGGKIIGIATMTIILGVGAGRVAYLNDFVVDSSVRGAGIGGKMWEAVLDWCKNNNVHRLEFTSSPKKEAAHKFYLKHGATIRDTAFFRKIID